MILLYRTEGLQPPTHEQAALALLNIESELRDLIDFSEVVQYFCDEYRAPARWGPQAQGPLQSFCSDGQGRRLPGRVMGIYSPNSGCDGVEQAS